MLIIPDTIPSIVLIIAFPKPAVNPLLFALIKLVPPRIVVANPPPAITEIGHLINQSISNIVDPINRVPQIAAAGAAAVSSILSTNGI